MEFLLLFCKIFMFCIFSRTKIENLAEQNWSADRTLGNTALDSSLLSLGFSLISL